MKLTERLALHAAKRPDLVALSWPDGQLNYADLLRQIAVNARALSTKGCKSLALDVANGPAWIVLDLAALELGICLIPLPPFFSAAQLHHILRHSGAEAVITDNPDRLRMLAGELLSDAQANHTMLQQRLTWITTAPEIAGRAASLPAGVAKITYTSGTTGEPKGVMLSWPQMHQVAASLAAVVELGPHDRHLTLMPLAVLLENIGGVYAPLWAGATIVLLPGKETGLSGSSEIDGNRLVQALRLSCATTLILTPQLLLAVTEVLEDNPEIRLNLRFAAVGGAPLSARLLQRSLAVGVPVFEGYGLSECASVVCLNTPQQQRPGSVGKPLPHVRLTISGGGEVLIGGQPFSGYLGERAPASDHWATGDLGELDSDGFLYLRGRRSNMFVTAFGRNIAPEWVERELTLEPEILQAAVFGEARPYNVAIIVAKAGSSAADIERALQRANSSLPDYARIARWITAHAPFSTGNRQLTGTGRIRRTSLLQHYQRTLDAIYCENQTP
ncbi:MAG: AMP-binding protein [Gammaproteobacteria bacterium]|nr:AMP-binding protein [Gammaproteobacteria bacterium]